MKHFAFLDPFLRAPDDGGAGGGDAGAAPAAPAADSGSNPAGASSGGAPAAGQAVVGEGVGKDVPASPYRPDGLPDHFLGANDRETVDKLHKAVEGFRKSMGDKGEVPKDAGAYAFEPSDTVKPYTEGLEGDAFFQAVKGEAHKVGLGSKQFNLFMNGIMSQMIEGGLVGEPFSADKEMQALLPDVADPKERATKADALVRDNLALIEAWKGRGENALPDSVHTFLQSNMDRAAANQLVAWVAAQMGETRPALGGAPSGGVTEAQVNARVADPRNRPDGPKYDPAFARETNRLFQALYPNH